MQPAVPRGVTLSDPSCMLSDIDLLSVSNNHNNKAVLGSAADDDAWIWSLVTLQTGAGYFGNGYFGAFRMNGGTSSRSLWAVYDRDWTQGRRVMEDARLMNAEAERSARLGGFTIGGIQLLWLPDWPEGQRFSAAHLDPRVIEVSRRVRLVRQEGGRLSVRTSVSKDRRTDLADSNSPTNLRGVTGDIFTPVRLEKDGSMASISMSAFGLTYRNLARIALDSSAHDVRPAPAVQRKVDNPELVVAGIANGQGKTEGFFRREISITGAPDDFFISEGVGDEGRILVAQAAQAASALRYAIGVLTDKAAKDNVVDPLVAILDDAVDRVFFTHLAAIIANEPDAVLNWARFLYGAARATLERAIETIPLRENLRWKRIDAATGAFEGTFWKKVNKDLAEMKNLIRSKG